jgi:NAD(P)-dependent dehydrogenase (short-subunit alcohol dehydrogenase family)
LTLLARDVDRLVPVADETGGRAARCDIRNREQVDRVVDEAVAESGPLYAIVANAGAGGPNDPGPADRFDELVATNLNGTYTCLRAAQRNLEPGPEARHFVVIASILARIGVPGYTDYCASKAGLLGLVQSFAAELGPENVQVNAICPGWVDTDMAWEGLELLASAITSRLQAQLSCQTSLRRMGTSSPSFVTPSTSISGPPIMKSVCTFEWLMPAAWRSSGLSSMPPSTHSGSPCP